MKETVSGAILMGVKNLLYFRHPRSEKPEEP